MRCLVSVLALGLLTGLVPAAAFAQQTDEPPEALQARCDLPVVDLFNPMPGDVLQPGDYLISGLALDPMAPADSSGIDRVSFFLGERDKGGVPLGTVVPSSGSRQADFTVTVTLPDNGAGQTQLQAFAHSALTGKETQVGMPIALGDDAAANAPADPSVNVINTNPGVLPDLCSPDDLPLPTVAQATPNTGTAAPEPTPALSSPAVGAAGKPNSRSVAPLFGSIVGSVTTCQGGIEQPVTAVKVQVQGTSSNAITDLQGVFEVTLVPAPGTYTISVADGGKTASRQYVPVAPGETIDIGTLQIGGNASDGCGLTSPTPSPKP